MTVAPPVRAPRGRGRRWLAWLGWLAILAVLVAGATFAIVGYRGDPEGAARAANSQLAATLEPGEAVRAKVTVYQRQWWDYYRHTWGVLAATNQRLVFAGHPPAPLLHPDDGPPPVVEASFPLSRGIAVSRGRGFLGRDRVVQLSAATARERLAVMPRDEPGLQAVLDEVARAQAALRAASDAERAAVELAAAASRRPVRHLVLRGEALDYIARRHGVTTDSLISWNALGSTRITVGSTLIVRPGRDP